MFNQLRATTLKNWGYFLKQKKSNICVIVFYVILVIVLFVLGMVLYLEKYQPQ